MQSTMVLLALLRPVLIYLAAAMLFAVLCSLLASLRRRSPDLWFLLGGLFGPLALVVIGLSSRAADPSAPTPQTHIRCPDCRELVRCDASVCMHCAARLVPVQIAGDPPWYETRRGSIALYIGIAVAILGLASIVR